MIKRTPLKGGKVKVTFSVPDEQLAGKAAVVGSFNDWSPFATPLVKRRGGNRSASVTIDAGETVEFCYLDESGTFFTEPAADDVVASPYGTANSMVTI